MGFPENDPKNDEDLKNYDKHRKNTVSDWNVAPNNYLTKPLITMDLLHQRLSSTNNVWYVSENILKQILLSIVWYHGNGPKMKRTQKIISDWNLAPNNYLTKPLITIDLYPWRLSSSDNVRYVSDNNLQQMLLSLIGYQQKAPRVFSCWIWLFS